MAGPYWYELVDDDEPKNPERADYATALELRAKLEEIIQDASLPAAESGVGRTRDMRAALAAFDRVRAMQAGESVDLDLPNARLYFGLAAD